MNFDLLRRGEPDRVATGVVSPNFFDVLGIKPIIGRTFVEIGRRREARTPCWSWATPTGRRGSAAIRHRRPGVRDERPAAHRRRRAAAGAALSERSGRLHADVACPFRSAAERQIDQNRRAFSALQVFGLLKAGASRGDGRRRSGHGRRPVPAGLSRRLPPGAHRVPGQDRRSADGADQRRAGRCCSSCSARPGSSC